jgi:hypothetical protein
MIREVFRVGFWLLVLLAPQVGLAFGQTEIPYEVRTIEILGLRDINAKDDFITSTQLLLRRNKYQQPITLACGATGATARRLNNQQEVAGDCWNGSGFVRHRDGSYSFLNVPGAGYTEIHALDDSGQACGFYVTPVAPNQSGFAGWHGFCGDGINYRTIDFPLENAVTVILGKNRNRECGAYFTYDLVTNGASEWTAFCHSNGVFETLIYPNGGSWSYPLKLHRDDTVLLLFDNSPSFLGGPGEPNGGYALFDDGRFFKISLPATIGTAPATFDIESRNDTGELVGTVHVQVTFDPCPPFPAPGSPPCPRFETHGFIATPIVAVAKR